MIARLARICLSAIALTAVAAAFQAAPLGTSPRRATLDSLDVAEGLAATLTAEAPTLTNPTNIDVDARGRIWVVEGFNYRKFKPKPIRPEGDRILILEDTTGDGVTDVTKVFYQGSDIDAAMGIAVLGTKIYVSAYRNVFVFTDANGDDKPDRKEVLFTSIGVDHDHSVHAMVFGPDGRMYFNGGNETGAIMDAAGKVLVDRAGNRVEQKRAPYQEGMAFRFEPDGTGFEVLANNFRNPYELVVDAYGTVWQTDNDDDGNRSTRLNYVMEGGNFGYKDEMTGAGWRSPRVGMSSEVPRRHWHSDDPGSVPNVRINGAGAPSGLAMYDGALLPERYRGTLIHAEPGTNEVRAFPLRADGAGYAADVIPLLSSTRDRMFRPVDVAVAPDGSLFVADWYDAGVGGHNMSDQTQGRIIRVAPPGARYTIPTLDLSTPAAAVRALRSPNHATRYLAYERVHQLGRRAEGALVRMYRSADPRDRARALWLLARIPERGTRHLQAAARDADPNIRIVAIRATRRIGADVLPIVERLVRDPSPAVRREVALALRHEKSGRAPALWAELASQHDGRDRWYLEALGIAADGQWDAFFSAWLAVVGDRWNTPAGRDIVWRARSARALPMLAQLASDSTADADRLRYFRALDFHQSDARQRTLLSMLGSPAGRSAALTPVILAQLDAGASKDLPEVQQALRRTLAATSGTSRYVELVEQYDARDQLDELVRLALAKPSESTGAESGRLAIQWGGAPRFAAIVNGSDESAARRALSVMGRNFGRRVDSLVVAVVLDASRPLGLRKWAVHSMGGGPVGQQRLLSLVQGGRLPEALKPAAGAVLFSASPAIRDSAAKHLVAPATTTLDGKSLPPLMTLAARTGDVAAGRTVFERSCSACHLSVGPGVDFGPPLTEIGDKLPKSGLYLAILDPSAGIGFGYEGHVIRMKDGQQLVGMITSETSDEIVLKLVGGGERRVGTASVADRRRMETSLMPQGLERGMTEAELVHLVEYLASLRRPR
ncbi:MAG: rane-bound dehydrogenase domain protein [Gemmatimonadetes bacterium]|nr:rane-bound dehydrogenase domain protein [Gemmatimonadota bacterium]